VAKTSSTSIWRHSAIAVAVGLCVASGASFAQSNVTGNIYGQVQAASGATVVIENLATGAKRTLTPDASGRFVASSLPTGSYKATLYRDGKVVGVSEEIQVLIGQGSEVAFAAAAATQTVQVVGKVAKIDVTSTNTGANFTAKQLDALPVARNLDAIIQLAPNTTKTDSRYAGGASFGGGAASENSYYINGFPVTNPLTQLGSSELPFGGIGQAQIQVGGFGVEFGRSIGGVVNLITKSGTNQWEAGAAASLSPDSLRSTPRDIYWFNTGANSSDGKLFNARRFNTYTERSLSGYVGGPLIEDQLFLFVAGEKITRDSGLVTGFGGTTSLENSARTNGWTDRTDVTNRYLGKLDWNITNDHRLELTLVGDRYARSEALSGFDYSTFKRNGVEVSTGKYTNDSANNLGVGASTKILKYTGYLTDDLTLQVMTGQSDTPHPLSLAGYNPNNPQVIVEGGGDYPGFTYNNLQTIDGTIGSTSNKDKVKASRFDLEYRLGDHSVRAGIDAVKLASLGAGDSVAGGRYLTYSSTNDANFKQNGMRDIIGNSAALQNGGLYYYGTERLFSNISNAYSDQNAQYIEDKWQVNKNLLLTFGLRNEQYKNKSSDGQVFLQVKDTITPRIAAAWDVNGDASLKVFGSAGRYAVQIPTGIALRGANSSLLTDQVFTYTGVAADGTPIGRVDLGPAFSANNEYGQPKDLKSTSALDMKPNLQDELIFGLEKAMSDELNVGARFTYRRLASTIDDYCDTRALSKWANDRGITDKEGKPFGYDPDTGASNLPFSCAAFNPGLSNTFLIDYNQDGTYDTVKLSAAELGFPKAKRSYMALDIFAEHPLKNGWYGKVNYTYAKNKGNTEGQTNSDLGQADIAQTVSWDHPELMEGSYGYLPNDRRHQIKAYGFMEMTPEFSIGANILVASGRPRSCLGVSPSTDEEFQNYVFYGSVYHYCGGVLSPRGTYGSTPWEHRLDMNFVYKPEAIKGLAFRADVFNITNNQVVQNVLERYENNNGTLRNSWNRPLSFTSPRSVKFTVSYDHKF
jgi:hypothetical protein